MSPRADVAPLFAELARARRVAILRLGSIGDIIETLPIAWLLRDLLGPTPEFCWLTHPESAQLLERVPAIDRVVVVPRSRILTSAPRWRRTIGGAPDVLLDLHGNTKSALVGLLSGARVRVGFHPSDCRERWNALGTN